MAGARHWRKLLRSRPPRLGCGRRSRWPECRARNKEHVAGKAASPCYLRGMSQTRGGEPAGAIDEADIDTIELELRPEDVARLTRIPADEENTSETMEVPALRVRSSLDISSEVSTPASPVAADEHAVAHSDDVLWPVSSPSSPTEPRLPALVDVKDAPDVAESTSALDERKAPAPVAAKADAAEADAVPAAAATEQKTASRDERKSAGADAPSAAGPNERAPAAAGATDKVEAAAPAAAEAVKSVAPVEASSAPAEGKTSKPRVRPKVSVPEAKAPVPESPQVTRAETKPAAVVAPAAPAAPTASAIASGEAVPAAAVTTAAQTAAKPVGELNSPPATLPTTFPAPASVAGELSVSTVQNAPPRRTQANWLVLAGVAALAVILVWLTRSPSFHSDETDTAGLEQTADHADQDEPAQPAGPPAVQSRPTASPSSPPHAAPKAQAAQRGETDDGETVKFRNPFDPGEVFEFPPGTSRADARDKVAELLLERARERRGRLNRR